MRKAEQSQISKSFLLKSKFSYCLIVYIVKIKNQNKANKKQHSYLLSPILFFKCQQLFQLCRRKSSNSISTPSRILTKYLPSGYALQRRVCVCVLRGAVARPPPASVVHISSAPDAWLSGKKKINFRHITRTQPERNIKLILVFTCTLDLYFVLLYLYLYFVFVFAV